MRKTLSACLAAVAVVALFAAPVAADEGDTQTIMVMKHFCDPKIQSEADFEAVEAMGAGNPVHALAFTVLNCPAGVNPGDATSDGIKADAIDFTFTVDSSAGAATASDDSTAGKLCETDVKLDANGDGQQTDDVCLDISHYMYTGVSAGDVTVTESAPPAGYRFGTLRFTPTEIDGNNDKESLVSAGNGVIKLDTAGDEDNAIMLHVYNFEGTKMPDSSTAVATESAPSGSSLPVALAVLSLLGIGGLTVATARRRS